MKEIQLWDNDLCPCCHQVPERSTTHLFLCPHPLIQSCCEKAYHAILDWLTEVHTDSLVLESLTSFWHGEDVVLDPEYTQSLQMIYNTMRDIGLHQMWMGFLPVGMIDFQAEYYQRIDSKKVQKRGGLILSKNAKCYTWSVDGDNSYVTLNDSKLDTWTEKYSSPNRN